MPASRINEITCLPPLWMPPGIRRKLLDQGRVTIRWSRPERKILQKKRLIPVSQWAGKYRVVTMSSIPGPWKNDVTPYLTAIMDASMFPSVRTVTLVATPQTGKSEAVHNVVGSCIDQYPGPVLYVYPDELTARENSRDRIQPMIESSRQLSIYMTGVQDDSGMLRINLQHMPIYVGWARSAARLANKPIKIVVCDETDKYPATAGPKETDPISLAEKRTITYRNSRKIFKISTPTTEHNFIWQSFIHEAEARFDYWVRCPECDREQKMILDRIRVPEDMRDPNEIQKSLAAWYECEGCGAHWDDQERNRAVRMGFWRERPKKTDDDSSPGLGLEEYLEKHRPQKIGFHMPSWISPFVSLSDVMSAWFACHYPVKDKIKLRDFLNAHKAEPWLDYSVERDEHRILALKDERPRGLVPSSGVVAGLTAAVDTHDDGFYYEVRAWGYGLEMESWQIRAGFVQSLAAIEQVLWEDEYLDIDGTRYVIHGTLIDSMGHRTAEVYEWARSNLGRVVPIKGEQRMAEPLKWSKIDTYPGNNKPIPGGLRLLRIDVTYYKDLLSSKLEIQPADPGAWHLHSEASWTWASQLCVEFVNDKGIWECPEGKRNEAWDLGVYNLACADRIGIKYWPRPKAAKKPKPKPKEERTGRIALW